MAQQIFHRFYFFSAGFVSPVSLFTGAADSEGKAVSVGTATAGCSDSTAGLTVSSFLAASTSGRAEVSFSEGVWLIKS